MAAPNMILNPKRQKLPYPCKSSLYPYYAGFSMPFAAQIIAQYANDTNAHVLDPWNGSGTTTYAAASAGISATGYDLNPVMVIAAKAMFADSDKGSLLSLATEIATRARSARYSDLDPNDALMNWLAPSSCQAIRSVDSAIRHLLIDDANSTLKLDIDTVARLSPLASFFYVALFRATRSILKHFIPSNPTWIKTPRNKSNRLRPTRDQITTLFCDQVTEMNCAVSEPNFLLGHAHLSVACSRSLPAETSSVDLILTSPPYCTRIDYAVATWPELAILGYSATTDFTELRKTLIGSTTVQREVSALDAAWGATCLTFLDNLSKHHSKASHSYYFKNHVQYFDSIYTSLQECARVLRAGHPAFFVVQDSFYKDIPNHLPSIFAEMAANCGFALLNRNDFPGTRTMANLNPATRRYRTTYRCTESVLHFSRTSN